MSQQARYQVRLQNTRGVTQAIFDDFRSLDYEIRQNDFGIITFSIDGDDPRCDLFTTDSIIQVWRHPDGHDWYKEAEFFHRTPNPQETETGLHTFTSYGRTFVDLLNRREIAYTGTTSFTQKAGSGEGVMKDYVRENAGVGAVSPPRKVNGVTPGLDIQQDNDKGSIWRGVRSMRNLLDVIKEISLSSHVDFDVIRLNDEGVPAFVFITGFPQIGRDLSDLVFFDTKFGNMIAPSYTKSRTEEANVLMILGPGDGVSQIVVTSQSLAVNDSPWNRLEVSHDARNQSTISQLFTVAEQELAVSAAHESLTFQGLQTESTQYGVHYRLGDSVTARFKDIVVIAKLSRVHVNVTEGKETIETEFANLALGSVDPVYTVIRNLVSRLRQLTRMIPA